MCGVVCENRSFAPHAGFGAVSANRAARQDAVIARASATPSAAETEERRCRDRPSGQAGIDARQIGQSPAPSPGRLADRRPRSGCRSSAKPPVRPSQSAPSSAKPVDQARPLGADHECSSPDGRTGGPSPSGSWHSCASASRAARRGPAARSPGCAAAPGHQDRRIGQVIPASRRPRPRAPRSAPPARPRASCTIGRRLRGDMGGRSGPRRACVSPRSSSPYSPPDELCRYSVAMPCGSRDGGTGRVI